MLSIYCLKYGSPGREDVLTEAYKMNKPGEEGRADHITNSLCKGPEARAHRVQGGCRLTERYAWEKAVKRQPWACQCYLRGLCPDPLQSSHLHSIHLLSMYKHQLFLANGIQQHSQGPWDSNSKGTRRHNYKL